MPMEATSMARTRWDDLQWRYLPVQGVVLQWQKGDIRGGAADVKHQHILVDRAAGEDTHNRGGRPEQIDCTGASSARDSGMVPPSALRMFTSRSKVKGLEAGGQGSGKRLEGPPHGGVVIHGMDTPAEVKLARDQVTAGNEGSLLFKGLTHPVLMGRVAR